jgi:predicted lipid-binding transport protein (Tim44 family)
LKHCYKLFIYDFEINQLWFFHQFGRIQRKVNFTIILLVAIAGFLGLRLYSVLGKRTGHEQQPLPPQSGRQSDIGRDAEGAALANPHTNGSASKNDDAADSGVELAFEPRAGAGLQAISMADRAFDPVRFLDGAKYAYTMILEAFWSDDTASLKQLCDDDVQEVFATATQQRVSRGETLDNKFISFEGATITDAQLDRGIARIAVRFDAFITAVTRNTSGEILSGSMSEAVETHDVWTFSRVLGNEDPNWVLDETDAA